MKNKVNLSPTLSVGELSKRSGVAVSALHFYEAKGLIYSWRTEGHQRRFSRGVLRVVSLIKTAQNLGFSLTEIKNVIDLLPKDRSPTHKEWQKLGKYWKEELNNKIKRLSLLRDRLDGCIGCGCLSMRECPLRNTNDKLSSRGPGPQLL